MIRILENNDIDLSVLEVSDLINMDFLQTFQDNFATAMNCASITVDRNGTPITKESAYTKFCISCVQSSAKGRQHCAESHKNMGVESLIGKKPYIGRCHAGLIDFSAAITVEGELLGTVLGGQLSDTRPTNNSLAKLADTINLDSDILINAASDINLVPMENIQAAAEVLYTVINALAVNGYNELKLSTLSQKLSENFLQISSTVEELSASATDIAGHQESLNDEIIEVQKITHDINEILESIKKIAAQIKMLGLNASIEASRVGDVGRGFAVVANEIKKLSESSKETANQISDLTSKIENSIESTINYSNISLGTTVEQSKAMEEVTSSIEDAVIIADKLTALLDSMK